VCLYKRRRLILNSMTLNSITYSGKRFQTLDGAKMNDDGQQLQGGVQLYIVDERRH